METNQNQPEEPIPSLPVALVLGFIYRPLLCVALCLACLGGKWWCNGQSRLHWSIATGFQMPPEYMTPDEAVKYRLGLAPDPDIMLKTERGKRHWPICVAYGYASQYCGYAAFGFAALGAFGGLRAMREKWRARG